MRADCRCNRDADAAPRRAGGNLRARALAAAGIALGVLAAGAPACTGEASFVLPTVDPGGPSGRYEAVCAGWARRECAYTDACNPGVFELWEDDDQCIARETLACELDADDPDVRFDPALVESCTFPPDCSAATGTVAAELAYLCLPPGKAPDGAPCTSENACQSGSCFPSLYSPVTACGTCHPPIHCGCTAHQQCWVTGDTDRCVDVPDPGEACGPPLFACNGSECVASSDGGEAGGVCQVVAQAGLDALCTTEPQGPECIASGANPLFCDQTDHCRAYRGATYGEPCTTAGGPEGIVCVGGGWCDSAGSGVCQPPAADGAPCNAQALPCLPPAQCLGSHCIFPTLATCSL